jgi:hypothetical protein
MNVAIRLTLMRAGATLVVRQAFGNTTMMRHAWALSVAILMYGCAATPPAPAAHPVTEDVVTIAPQSSDVTCSIERPTGTKIA